MWSECVYVLSWIAHRGAVNPCGIKMILGTTALSVCNSMILPHRSMPKPPITRLQPCVCCIAIRPTYALSGTNSFARFPFPGARLFRRRGAGQHVVFELHTQRGLLDLAGRGVWNLRDRKSTRLNSSHV